MDTWTIIEVVIVAALLGTWILRGRLGDRFTPASLALSALLVVTCLVRWITEGASTWTMALGALAVILLAVTAFAARRPERGARTQ
jgi:hypothetical protein